MKSSSTKNAIKKWSRIPNWNIYPNFLPSSSMLKVREWEYFYKLVIFNHLKRMNSLPTKTISHCSLKQDYRKVEFLHLKIPPSGAIISNDWFYKVGYIIHQKSARSLCFKRAHGGAWYKSVRSVAAKVTFLFPRANSAEQPAENNQSCMKRYQNFFQFLQMKLKQARHHLINVYRFIGTVKHSKALFKWIAL